MTPTAHLVPWTHDAWAGLVDDTLAGAVEEVLAQVAAPPGRRSRHAWTRRLEVANRVVWLKVFPPPGARFAHRAFAMHQALADAGMAVPRVVLVGWAEQMGLLVTEDAGGRALLDVVPAAGRATKRDLLRRLGEEVARVHRAGFVPGDLVPSNVIVREGAIVLLDHDRTRRGRLLVWWNGRRNLVQLGRFVVPGVGLTDRARVLRGYAAGRGWGRRHRRRLARWLITKITARRVRFDGIGNDVAKTVGFGELMRSGGPWDPAQGGR